MQEGCSYRFWIALKLYLLLYDYIKGRVLDLEQDFSDPQELSKNGHERNKWTIYPLLIAGCISDRRRYLCITHSSRT